MNIVNKKIAFIGLLATTLAARADNSHPALYKLCPQSEWFQGIPFAPNGEEKDYRGKVDFAELEYYCPIPQAALEKLTLENLSKDKGWNQERLDQLYARLKPGAIPDGKFDGGIVFADGGGMAQLNKLFGK